MRFRLSIGLLAGAAVLALAASAASATVTQQASWASGSQSINGNRNQPLETTINTSNVGQLKPKWTFTDHGDVSATPTVANGVVYFPDWGGYLNAVNASNGSVIWQKQISAYDGQAGAVSRNSPLILGNDLILGDNASSAQPGGAHLFAVDRATGNLVWSTQLDSHPAAIVTSNPVAIGGQIVVGVASNEENDATQASYPCCTFRGSVVAVNATNGHIIWKTYTIPANSGPCTHDDLTNGPSGCGFSGGAVWATPTIDPQTNQVFVGTGNNYTATDAANACETNAEQTHTSDANCTPSNDYFDSVLALDMNTGKIEWADKVQGWDAWNVACVVPPYYGTWCPSIYSPDWDFGGGSPNLFTGANGEKLVGDGQKSGVYWAFDEKTGKIVWSTSVGPGSSLGGIEWGSAFDGTRIYVAIANPFHSQNTGGSWSALDPSTGKILWQTAVPGGNMGLGPVSSATGVVYAASMDTTATDPTMFALDASTGNILWNYPAGSSVNAAPAIVNGTLYWGSGYGRFGPSLGTSNNQFYAFSINGQ